MLVEDEEIIRNGLKKMIEQVIGGYTICAEAENAEDALLMLEKVQPDILITDIKMENMNGLEMIRKIKLKNDNLPIIIISGYAYFQFAKEAILYGASAYLLKPVNRMELMQVLEKCVPVQPAEEDESHNLLIQKVKAIIKEKLGEEISLRNIADEIGINHQYLSALFKECTGKNFSKYVTEKRIQNAKRLLKDTNLKIYEIAEMSGYRSMKHFANVFRENVNCTPSEYRNK
jgi:YesN/AraC family two-component response regulator